MLVMEIQLQGILHTLFPCFYLSHQQILEFLYACFICMYVWVPAKDITFLGTGVADSWEVSQVPGTEAGLPLCSTPVSDFVLSSMSLTCLCGSLMEVTRHSRLGASYTLLNTRRFCTVGYKEVYLVISVLLNHHEAVVKTKSWAGEMVQWLGALAAL